MTNNFEIPKVFSWEQNTPAHELARTRLMLTVHDVDQIQWATKQLAHVRDLRVWDLGAGSGTTAAAVLSVRSHHVHGSTVDIDQQNLDWARKFLTNTWPSGFVTQDPFPVDGTWMASFDPPLENVQWRWINSDSVPTRFKVRNGSVNLLMIDTSHEYEATLAELRWWRAKVAHPDHFVWLDDYSTYPGVKQAVDELLDHGTLQLVEQDARAQGILCKYEAP